MRSVLDPFQFVVIAIAGWMNPHQQQVVVEYLLEENRVLREQIGSRRMRFNDGQRRRLAVRAKKLGRRVLNELATIVTPETLLAWHRKLSVEKYDGSASRMPGRPRMTEAPSESQHTIRCGIGAELGKEAVVESPFLKVSRSDLALADSPSMFLAFDQPH
jgi:hypothetical protein